MTLEEAKEDITNFDSFVSYCCNRCTSNDWYCTSLCEVLEKAKRIPFDRIQKAYARHDGDMMRVIKYIRRAKC